jgi:hypothetical protein
MFEDITIGLLWLATTWFVANIFIGISDALRETNVELRQELTKRLDEIIHRVREEQVDDTIYWYDQDNGKFLAQGHNQEEIIAVIRTRFPDHIFYLENNQIIAQPHWQPRDLPITVTHLTKKS